MLVVPFLRQTIGAAWLRCCRRGLSQKNNGAHLIAKKHKAPIPLEWQEQVAVVDWWRSYAPTVGLDPRLLVCSANGAILGGDKRLRAIQMGRLKRMGLVEGDPDLHLRLRRASFCGLFIEMKRSDWHKPVSGKALAHYARQRAMWQVLGEDYCVRLATRAEEAIDWIMQYVRLGK